MNMFNLPTWKRCQLTPRDQRNQLRALLWLFIWVVSWVLANGVIKNGWGADSIPASVIALPSLILGVVMMLAYWKFVREADELQRKIQVEALAVGFGVGLVGSYSVHLLTRAGVLSSIEMSEIGALMMVAYAVAAIVGERRYA